MSSFPEPAAERSGFSRPLRTRVHILPARYGYALAVATVAAAMGLRFAVSPLLGERWPYLLFFGATVVSAAFAGLGPGVVAMLLGALCAELFIRPTLLRAAPDAGDVTALTLYGVVSLMCILVCTVLDRWRYEAASMSGTLRRQTELLRSESAQRLESQALLLLSQHVARIGSWVRDLRTGRVIWSESLAGILALPDVREGSAEDLHAHVLDEDRPALERAIEGASAPGSEYEAEYRIRGPDGAVRWMREHGRRQVTAVGERLIGITKDVTPQRESEARAGEMRAALAEFQAGETRRIEAELGRVRDLLVRQTRLAAIGQLSAGIAHDLRNPLGVIRNATYLLRRRAGKGDAKTSELLRMIEDEVRSADAIITNLMEMTRGRDPERSDVDLGALASAITSRIDSSGRVSWRVEAAPAPFMLWCDPNQFRQVLTNLCRNSVEAMKGRGEVQIAAWRSDARDYIEVRDSGPGVAPEVRERLFEPLMTSKKTGTGLGLLICRQIIERHGGAIGLEQRDGGGAVFRIALPRRPALQRATEGGPNGQ